MYQKTFVCLSRQTVSPIYTIFNAVHSMSDMNKIFKLQDIWGIFTRVRACTVRWTVCINTFQFCWKLLKSKFGKSRSDYCNQMHEFFYWSPKQTDSMYAHKYNICRDLKFQTKAHSSSLTAFWHFTISLLRKKIV